MEFKIISQSELQQKLVEFKKCIDSDERLPKNIGMHFITCEKKSDKKLNLLAFL